MVKTKNNLLIMRIESKIFAIFLFITILIGAFYKRLQEPTITDKKITLSHYTPQQITKAHKSIVEVKTGLQIKNFSEFDIIKPKFVFDGIVWFLFDPLTISPDTIEKFAFEKAKIIQKSEASTKEINNKLFTFYEVKVEFTSDLNFSPFPFDDHRLAIQLTNRHLLPSEVRLSSNSTLLLTPKNVHTKDLILNDQYIDFGYTTATVDPYNSQKNISYPLVVYYLEFVKSGIRKVLIIFLPLFVIFFLGLLSLAINILLIKVSTSVSIGSLSALLFYRFVIENITPSVGYFTIADKIYLVILSISFVIFLHNIILTKYVQPNVTQNQSFYKLRLIRSILFYTFGLLVSLVSAYFVLI